MMKRIIYTLMFLLSGSMMYAHERMGFVEMQLKQAALVEEVYKSGRVTENEYLKLKHEQQIIKESIALADLDHNWTAIEHNTVYNKLKRASKRLARYQRNGERF